MTEVGRAGVVEHADRLRIVGARLRALSGRADGSIVTTES